MSSLSAFVPLVAGAVGVIVFYKFTVQNEIIKRGEHCFVEYSKRTKCLVLCFSVIILLIDYTAFRSQRGQELTAFLLASIMTVGYIWWVLETFFSRIIYDKTMLTVTSAWSKKRGILWDDILDYRWSDLLQGYVFYSKKSGKFYISAYISGLKGFLEKAYQALKRTHPERFVAQENAQFNESEVNASTVCGCFNCMAIFSPKEIVSWIAPGNPDRTAICPKCDIQTVVGDASGYPIESGALRKVHNLYFK